MRKWLLKDLQCGNVWEMYIVSHLYHISIGPQKWSYSWKRSLKCKLILYLILLNEKALKILSFRSLFLMFLFVIYQQMYLNTPAAPPAPTTGHSFQMLNTMSLTFLTCTIFYHHTDQFWPKCQQSLQHGAPYRTHCLVGIVALMRFWNQ